MAQVCSIIQVTLQRMIFLPTTNWGLAGLDVQSEVSPNTFVKTKLPNLRFSRNWGGGGVVR